MSTPQSNKTELKVKKDLGFPDLVIGLVMGCVLTAFNIVDVSVISYIIGQGNISLASSYVFIPGVPLIIH